MSQIKVPNNSNFDRAKDASQNNWKSYDSPEKSNFLLACALQKLVKNEI
jgi:hypothetical protein